MKKSGPPTWALVLTLVLVIALNVILWSPQAAPLWCPDQPQSGVVDSRGIAVGPTGPACR